MPRRIVANSVRRRRPRREEEDSGVRPFFEPRKTRNQDRECAADFPEAEDRTQIGRISQVYDTRHSLWLPRKLSNPAREHGESKQNRGEPIPDRFSVHLSS